MNEDERRDQLRRYIGAQITPPPLRDFIAVAHATTLGILVAAWLAPRPWSTRAVPFCVLAASAVSVYWLARVHLVERRLSRMTREEVQRQAEQWAAGRESKP